MWKRDVTFLALLIVALIALTAGVLRRDRMFVAETFPDPMVETGEFSSVVSRINEEFERYWSDKNIQTAPLADELTIARRLSLGLTGAVPSLEEVRSLQSLPTGQRIEWWQDHLLGDRRYADYVAERLTRAYVGTENGPFLIYRRRRFRTWLSDQLMSNVAYDQIVLQIISSTGIWTSTPAVNFVSATIDQDGTEQPDPIRLAGRTARAFLGLRLDCLQCHDDKLGNVELGEPDDTRDGTQKDFHRLAAFYSDATVSLGGIRDQANPYKYQFLGDPEEKVVAAEPPFLPELHRNHGTQREQLANWVTHPENRSFARATVNRVWALMFGRPLVEPIDDIPLYGSLPPGMETLADDLIASGYDLQRLIRLIAATDVYRLDSRADFEITDRHQDAWAVFPLVRLRPEQVAGSLIQSASLKTIDADSHIFTQLSRFGDQTEFVKRYGDTGEDEFEDRGGTITQRLLMMNGELVRERTRQNPFVNAATKIAILAPDSQRAIKATYLAVLTRLPSDRELKHFTERLADKTGDARVQALEDIYWTLLNSTEFSWNH